MFPKCLWCAVAAMVLALVAAGSARADALRVVATGDSNTNGYAPSRLQAAFNAEGPAAAVFCVASGGCASDRYVGEALDPDTGTFRDFAAEVVALDPDVIIFMLGTNDAHRSEPGWFLDYMRRISDVFDTFGAAVNSRGRSPLVIVSAVLPVLYGQDDATARIANTLIDYCYNPWLARQARDRGFIFVDVNTAIRRLDNWQDLYSDNVHLSGVDGWGTGYTWLARHYREVIAKVLEIPGDLDGDGDVDLDDFVRLKQSFGTTGLTGDADGDGDVDLDEFVILKQDFGKVAPAGDTDHDGDVDLDDFAILKQNFGRITSAGDADHDGDVDLDDLVILKQDFGKVAPTGDVDHDGDVDLDDFIILKKSFGAIRSTGDADHDGDVDLDDFVMLKQNFGTGTAVVPEP